jgi:hypothetical protein
MKHADSWTPSFTTPFSKGLSQDMVTSKNCGVAVVYEKRHRPKNVVEVDITIKKRITPIRFSIFPFPFCSYRYEDRI